ncbi:MAG: ZIP family metal transporter [Endomicrobiales bacterium]|jgi:ZIP family zinc transporter/zinc and cadmium transporter
MGLLPVVLYSVVAGMAIVIGMTIVLKNAEWAKKRASFIISFAAGVMLTTAFMHLIPDAFSLNNQTLLLVFAGFLIFYLLQQGLMFHACGEEECPEHKLGVMSSIGLTIHSALDGVAIAAGFEADWRLGIVTTIAILMHKMPEGITITGILIHCGMPRTKVIRFSVIVAVATPIAALFSYFFLKNVSGPILGGLLALTAGSFIYLAAADLLPETHRVHHRANALFFFAGIGLIGMVGHVLH